MNSDEEKPLLLAAAPKIKTASKLAQKLQTQQPTTLNAPTSSKLDAKQRKQPNRTTKTNKKLVVFPTQGKKDIEFVDDALSEVNEPDLQPQKFPLDVVKEREAERIKKISKEKMARVTAYSTAKEYKMERLMKWLESMRDSNQTDPIKIDECIYSPFSPPPTIFQFKPPPQSRPLSPVHYPTPPINLRASSNLPKLDFSTPPDLFSDKNQKEDETIDIQSVLAVGKDEGHPAKIIFEDQETQRNDFQLEERKQSWSNLPKAIQEVTGEIFFFDYGVVVFWGLNEGQEMYLLSLLKPFEEEKLTPDLVETEEFHYQYRAFTQPRIYNDVITLKTPGSQPGGSLESIEEGKYLVGQRSVSEDYMIKLTISHAIAQSVKLTLFENTIDETIELTAHIPLIMAKTGKVPMSRSNIIQMIGQLFVMRMNVNLVSPILDTPEIFWSEPTLEGLYSAARGYLEISQRVELVNLRVSVLSDLLEMLKDHLNATHGEKLEWIIIILIAVEIVIGGFSLVLDLISASHKN